MEPDGEAPPAIRVAAALAIVYFVWGSTYLAIRFAIETLPAFLMAGTRFLIAGAVLYAAARASGAARPTISQLRAAAVAGAFFLLGGNGSVVFAEHTVPSGTAALLIATMPLWLAALEAGRRGGERPSRMSLAGLVTGFLGTMLLVAPHGGAPAVDVVGAGALVLGALSWSIGSIYARNAPLPPSPFVAAACEMAAGGVLLVVVGVLLGETSSVDTAGFSPRSLAAFAYLVVFGSIVAFSAFAWLVRSTAPTVVATYAYVNPLVAVGLGAALGGETLDGRMVLGGAVVVASVAAVTMGRSRPAPAPSVADEVADGVPSA